MSVFNYFTAQDWIVLAVLLCSSLTYLLGYYRGRYLQSNEGSFSFDDAQQEILRDKDDQIQWLREFVNLPEDDEQR